MRQEDGDDNVRFVLYYSA